MHSHFHRRILMSSDRKPKTKSDLILHSGFAGFIGHLRKHLYSSAASYKPHSQRAAILSSFLQEAELSAEKARI